MLTIWGLIIALSTLGVLAGGYLPPQKQLLMGGMLILILLVVGRFEPRLKRPAKIFLLLLAGFLTLRYWIFRTTQTIGFSSPLDLPFALTLYLAESYGILIHIFGMMVNVWPTNRQPAPLPDDAAELPTVDVFIPTYDEPLEVVETTVIAARQMAYPRDKLTVYILDDGGTQERLTAADPAKAREARERAAALKAVAAQWGAVYQARDANRDAKAGNLNDALFQCECQIDDEALDRIHCVNTGLAVSCGELVLVLDCDHVPTRDFLENTVGFFLKDPKLFLVQTPHHFINPGPVEKNLGIYRKGPSENEMFYGVIQRGLDFWNAAFFCGSAALLRRRHLMAAGGLAGQTITEDAETSLALHARGLNSVYLYRPLVIGLMPDTYDHFIVQRSRWAQGMVQIFRLKNPLLQKGLSPAQRIGYFNACFFWFFGLARIVFYLAPMLFLLFGLRIYNASLLQVAAYVIPHLVSAYYVANKLYGRYRHPFFSEFYETVQSIYLAPAVLAALFKPRAPVFRVTPKAVSLKQDFLSQLALPFYGMAVASVAAQVIGWLRWHGVTNAFDALFLCSLWNGFNLFLVLCCLGVVWERRQQRRSHRIEVSETAALRGGEEDTGQALHLTDLSSEGFAGRVSASSRFRAGDRLRLMARDRFGDTYDLPATVRYRRQDTDDSVLLGCEFILDTPEQRRQVVAYVFGDSHRWQFFGDRSPEPTVSTLYGLLKLLKLGLRGSAANLAGLYRLGRTWALTILARLQTSLLERIALKK